jgi:hypothetical protein
MTLVGPAVLDIVQHFVERWNEIKKRKVRRFVPASLPRVFSHLSAISTKTGRAYIMSYPAGVI